VAGVEWGEWDALPGENPDDCLRSENADKITQVDNVITDGAITDGAIEDGAITEGDTAEGETTEVDVAYGAIESGEVKASGTAKVFVNGKLLPSIPTV
jgi:hypothetical protein